MPQGPDKRQFEEVLRRAAAGDEDAWRRIVDTFAPRVHGLIRAQSGSSDLAEEITQSTFCTVAAKIGSYTEQGKFEPWVFRIAMNRFRDEMRRRKRQARPIDDETLVGLAGQGNPDPDPGEVDSERLAALEAAMARLSEADRRIVHLRHLAGLSFKQIADVLGQPLGTVLARQHRALKKLRDLVGEEES